MKDYRYDSHQNLQEYFQTESFFSGQKFLVSFFSVLNFSERRQRFPQGKKQNNIIFQLVLVVTNACFCKVLLDHQIKVTGEVENVIKKFTDLIFHRFKPHLPAKYYTSLSTVKSVQDSKLN